MPADFSDLTREEMVALVFRQDGRLADGREYRSMFVRDLRRARELARRDPETGGKEPKGTHGAFKGAMLYLQLLAEIGRSVVPKKARSEEGDAVHRALDCFLPGTSFEGLGAPGRSMIAALRRASGDGMTLVAADPADPTRRVRFVLVQRGEVVALPKEGALDGDGGDALAGAVHVNLERLGDLVEEVVARVREMAGGGELWCVLKGGAGALLEKMAVIDDSRDTRWRV
jgi:hypothetical protein